MKYKQLVDVLKENEQILKEISEYSRGGAQPIIIGLSFEANQQLLTQRGRVAAVEFAKATLEQRAALNQHRVQEALHGKKRPHDVLEQHVGATSALIAAFASRLQFYADHP